MFFPRFVAAALLTASIASATYAVAQGAVGGTAPASPAVADAALPLPELVSRLEAQGYHNAKSIERKSDKLVEIKAVGPDGQRKEIYVDSRTGEIMKVERD